MKQIGLFLVLLFFGSHAVLSQVPSYVDTNGLVGWWPFDGNANDFSYFANPSVNYGVTFDVSHLKAGNYILLIKGENNEVLKTEKFNKY